MVQLYPAVPYARVLVHRCTISKCLVLLHLAKVAVSQTMFPIRFGNHQRAVGRKEEFNIPAGTITPYKKKDESMVYGARISVNIGAAKSPHNCHLGQTWATPELASAALRRLCGQGYKKGEKFRAPSFDSVEAMKIRAKQIRAERG